MQEALKNLKIKVNDKPYLKCSGSALFGRNIIQNSAVRINVICLKTLNRLGATISWP